jgi:hypothetical protein
MFCGYAIRFMGHGYLPASLHTIHETINNLNTFKKMTAVNNDIPNYFNDRYRIVPQNLLPRKQNLLD